MIETTIGDILQGELGDLDALELGSYRLEIQALLCQPLGAMGSPAKHTRVSDAIVVREDVACSLNLGRGSIRIGSDLLP